MEQKSFHPSFSSTVLEPQRLVEKMPVISSEYHLTTSASSNYFPVSEVMF